MASKRESNTETDGSAKRHRVVGALVAAGHGDEASLRELGAAACLAVVGPKGETPAHDAAGNGHKGCLHVLQELGAGACLSAEDANKLTPAHYAATNGHERCLRALYELGAGTSLSAEDASKRTPAHCAAGSGHESCLRALHELGAGASLSAEDARKATPAHGAARRGHEGCLRTLHELGAGASLSAEDANKATPAHDAAGFGHEGCLRALHELGASASLSAEDLLKATPAHCAAGSGHEGCLHALHELGAGASLSAEDANKATPAHFAAGSGHEGCLQVLHECLSATIDPLIGELSKFRSTFTATINKLEAMKALTDRNLDLQTPAHTAAAAGHTLCVESLSKIGATSALLQDLQDQPELIEDEYECLLSNPRLLDLPTKQAWLSWSLENQVGEADEEQLELISRRDNMLEGLCAMLGVDESSGQLLNGADAPQPRAIDVQFEGENGTGDGLRREWFDGIVSEMLDGGLFISKDGGRSLMPNPHSSITAADHLSYFALLGRIAGLALYHREPLNASWSISFIKAVLGFELTPADLDSVDPEAYEKKIMYLQDGVYSSRDGMVISDLALTFTDGSEPALLYESTAQKHACVELKEGGGEIGVTEENKAEYIQLLVEHRLVGAIRPQIAAFLNGLSVFVTAELREKLQRCMTAADMQLLMCGVHEIDVDDWQASAEYRNGFDAHSTTVQWFWSAVRSMSNEKRAALLLFCTGSARAPATGFAHLMGYSGNLHQFCLQRVEGGSERLPTAQTCFNTLRLPDSYANQAQLLERLHCAMCEAGGFDEGAVAE